MTPSRLPIVLIAAVARNGVIGHRNRLPWHLPGDLAHFRAETMGKPVIFGRRTLEAIGKPLAGRTNIVLSRDPAFRRPGIVVVADLESALARAQAIGAESGASAVVIAGGASVYAAALPLADKLLITSVDLSPIGDATFPPIDPASWQEDQQTVASPRDDDTASYTFVSFVRNGPSSVTDCRGRFRTSPA